MIYGTKACNQFLAILKDPDLNHEKSGGLDHVHITPSEVWDQQSEFTSAGRI